MNNLKAWMLLATPQEQEALAAGAGTSRKYLYHLANAEANYGRGASPDLARRLGLAAQPINAKNPRLPRVLRVDLAEACRGCEYAAKCLGEQIIAEASFDVLSDKD